MNNVKTYDDAAQVAAAAAKLSVDTLKSVIDEYGHATWVLAGGSTPLLGYKTIAADFHDALDWSKVTLVMGDERIGPLDGPDNNWHAINQILGNLPTAKSRPQSDKRAEDAATDYEQQLLTLPKGDNGLPRLDLVWLGMGADGHTMSLFPQHSSLLPSGGLIVAVHDSPKPPADRISLTLRALQATTNLMILATGADKRAAVSEAVRGAHSPVGLAATIVATHDGNVTWLVDKKAAPTD